MAEWNCLSEIFSRGSEVLILALFYLDSFGAGGAKILEKLGYLTKNIRLIEKSHDFEA